MTDRVVLISGAGNGINRRISLVLAAEGYSIGVLDMNESMAGQTVEMVTRQGGNAIAVTADVADRRTVDQAVDTVMTRFGRVDAMVSGAGHTQDAHILDMREEDFDRMIAVHLKGAFNMIQAVLPHMKERGFGRIVCISSNAGTLGSWNHSHYAAAKAGILGLVRGVAKDVGEFGITVNSVLPGMIDVGHEKPARDPRALARVSSPSVGRIGRPTDIAYAVRYLVSDDASYVTGIDLPVHGGI
jgi:NAD(P)-dependent dehydrogenase (short-subunit alcohol dehydrogenase family)